MPKEKKKSEGRKSTLAPYVKEGFNIFGTYKGKKLEARVRADGMVIFRDKEFTSPSFACMEYINKDGKDRQVNGWLFWSFKKDGEEVSLNTLRGAKFARKAVKPRKAKAKKAAAPKVKAARKPRAKKIPRSPETPSEAQSAETAAM